ncbi:MAG: EthD family reductase [Anaerolineales bacterium]|nr:EthD family reductase [Anaerolineales bacterium]MCB9128143.1 EthD family reductase [Ardenticatenales bacterium]MCB9171853.1 EthD family reductase [Ardenticatenales bacterium]
MYKLVAIYRTPADSEAFDRHYAETHSPLMDAVPGYERIEVSRVTRPLMGDDFYLMFEMWFADKEALKTALRSPENAAAGKDLMGFAGDLVSVFTAEVV